MRRERMLFAAIAVLLVLARSWIPTALEGFYFDSDQAIVGLMALHISRLQHFPLYYYSLHYLLAVQAWLIAIAFWLFHPSVAVMRLPLVLLNVVVAVWLMAETSARARLRPALAFAAALPFVIPTPATAAHLVEAAGASIEPFVYVLLLWRLRRRPFAFGIVLAVGTLHREFTLFALPALAVAVLATDGLTPLLDRAALRFGARTAAAIALVWLIIDDMKQHVGEGSVALQAASLGGQLCGDSSELLIRARTLVTRALPVLFGATPEPLNAFRLDTSLVAGSQLAGIVIAIALVAMTFRAGWLWRTRPAESDPAFGIYLAVVGACASLAYPLSCNVRPDAPPLLRYLLLALLLPVGISIVFFQRERIPAFRAAAVAALTLWAGANAYDHVRLIRSSTVAPPLNERRVLSDYLVVHHIGYARAIYWDAYVIDFLTQERVVTASVDTVRIPAYQKQVDEHAAAAVNLARVPCEGGERIASWCVQKP